MLPGVVVEGFKPPQLTLQMLSLRFKNDCHLTPATRSLSHRTTPRVLILMVQGPPTIGEVITSPTLPTGGNRWAGNIWMRFQSNLVTMLKPLGAKGVAHLSRGAYTDRSINVRP